MLAIGPFLSRSLHGLGLCLPSPCHSRRLLSLFYCDGGGGGGMDEASVDERTDVGDAAAGSSALQRYHGEE